MPRTVFCLAVVLVGCGADGSSGTTGGATDGSSESSGGATGNTPTTMTPTGGDPTTDPDTSTSTTDPSTDASGDGTTSGTSDGTTGEPEECPPGQGCVAAPPPDWSGPIAFDLEDGNGDPQDCIDDYDEEVVFGHRDFEVGATSCDCDCTIDSTLCNRPTTLSRGSTCGVSEQDYPLSPIVMVGDTPDTVIFMQGEDTGDRYWYDEEAVATVNASPVPTVTTPEPAGLMPGRGCGSATELQSCAVAEGVCAPAHDAAFDQGLCIWRVGDHDCDGEYPAKTLLYRDFADDRECSECTVADTGGTCGTVTRRYENPFGSDIIEAVIPADGCSPSSGNIVGDMLRVWIDRDDSVTDPSCTPSAVTASGSVVQSDPVTVCCTE